MDAKGRIPPSSIERSIQPAGMMRHGPFPGSEPAAGHHPREPLSHTELLEDKISAQAAEMERLAVENRRLAATQVVLREDLVSAHQEVQRLKAHIRSIESESDIQIRILLEKIAKMEADIRVGESVKKDLRQAHIEARNLVMDRQELTARIQHASHELHMITSDVKKLPEMHAQIESLRKEHERLRSIFEHEKNSNIEQVQQLQLKEKNLVSMVKEVERLRVEVVNAETKARAPPAAYGSGYMIPDQSYQSHMQGGVSYADGYGRPLGQTGAGEVVPYGSNNPAAGEGMVSYDGTTDKTGVSTCSGWGGAHYMQGGAPYVDGYGRPLEGMGAAASTPTGGVWGGTHHMQGGDAYVGGYARPPVQMGAEGGSAYSNSNVAAGRPHGGGGGSGEGRFSHGSSYGAAGDGGGGAHDPALPQR